MKKYKYNKKRNLKAEISKRYNILIIILIVLMVLLLTFLFKIQIVNYDKYNKLMQDRSKTLVYSNSAPRGRIYDRNGRVIVDNKPELVIYYKKPNGITLDKEIELSYKILNFISIDETKLSLDNLKNFWIKTHKDEAQKKITDEEYKLYDERKLTSNDIEKLKKERITDSELDSFNDLDKKAAYIYYLMNVGYSYAEKIIKKENVTDIEYALVAENKDILDGFDVRLDWNRTYPYGDVFKTILGNVSSIEVGIPYELKDYYLNLGYNLNDRVGTSYLEYQYESLLKGEKTVYELLSDGSYKKIYDGKRGHDIVLTIDIELQKEVEKILEEEIIKAKNDPNTRYYNSSYAIISDPNSGEILAMSGKILKDNKIYDYTPAIITMPVTPGSIVKGASHTVGYATGNLKIGEVRLDECIKIAGTPKKCSYKDLGSINDLQAIAYSSNVYQYLTAIKVGGSSYKYNKSISINKDAFDTYRYYFKQYGLGVYTGIDLPNEALGYTGNSVNAGHLLDFAIGQYDTYTPIELSQYINTIANGGSRLKPYLLKAVYNPTKDPLTDMVYENTKTELNKVEIEDKYLNRIKQGFRMVMTDGSGVSYIDSKYKAAGKTGTSESFIDSDNDGVIDKETLSNTFGGFAPYDNPIVSFLVISPNVYYKESNSTARSGVNRKISYRISQKYFEIYK